MNDKNFLTVVQSIIDTAKENAFCKLREYSRDPNRIKTLDNAKIRQLVEEFFKEAEEALTKGCQGFEFRLKLRIENLKWKEYEPLQEKMKEILKTSL